MADQPQRVGPLELLRALGEGGQGSVWLARDTRDGRTVALKLLHQGTGGTTEVARLRREAALLMSILDPGLPAGFFFLEDEKQGIYGLVMDYVEGIQLRELRRERGQLNPLEAWTIIREVARVVGVLHATGVVHRDIKMANILLRPGWETGAAGSLVLVDLGIARGLAAHSTAYTTPGGALGSLPFMAPELLLEPPTEGTAPSPNVDVYALGVLLWFLLFDQHPSGLALNADLVEYVRAHLKWKLVMPHPNAVDRVEQVIPGVINVVKRCIEPRPADRYADALELYTALSNPTMEPVPVSGEVQSTDMEGPPDSATLLISSQRGGPISVPKTEPDLKAMEPLSDTIEMPMVSDVSPPSDDPAPPQQPRSAMLQTVPRKELPSLRTGPRAKVETKQGPNKLAWGLLIMAAGLAFVGGGAVGLLVVARVMGTPLPFSGTAEVSAETPPEVTEPGQTTPAPSAAIASPTVAPANSQPPPAPCTQCPYGVVCKNDECTKQLDPEAEWRAEVDAQIRTSGTAAAKIFPGGGERLCVALNRTGAECCWTGGEKPCSLRVKTKDLTAGGQGLRAVLRNVEKEVWASVPRIRAKDPSFTVSTRPHELPTEGTTFKPGTPASIEHFRVTLEQP